MKKIDIDITCPFCGHEEDHIMYTNSNTAFCENENCTNPDKNNQFDIELIFDTIIVKTFKSLNNRGW